MRANHRKSHPHLGMRDGHPKTMSKENSENSRASRNAALSDRMHERARESGVELQKLMIALATGVLAAYFVGMTTKADPPLTTTQQACSAVGLVAMAIAIGSGVFGWHSDTKRNYLWARALVAEEPELRKKLYGERDAWLSWKNRATSVMRLAFSIGVCSSSVYVLTRVFVL